MIDESRVQLPAAELPAGPLAVLLQKPDPQEPRIRHSGLLYEDAKGHLRCLHLAWHRIMLDSQPDEPDGKTWGWVVPPLLPERADVVAAFCDQVGESARQAMEAWNRLREAREAFETAIRSGDQANLGELAGKLAAAAEAHATAQRRSVPYALSYTGGRFHPEKATLELEDEEHGLTCATFVLAVLKGAGVVLLDHSEWTHREEDVEWHGLIVARLERSNAPAEHVAIVKNQEHCARIRPEEVAAAAAGAQLPASFADASRCGPCLLDRLSA